ncbi:Wadjet anti-phage system protein JetD domain-containing protein [Ferrigenium kumadai]|uniref:Wadjet anti-phage system protein JetD domain-containing protein n=1 Tax=Ferrigenium kumadai TaxID=1682490 RepID=UPI001BB3D41E|nr:Wadjet anti-phage system protein JetD domain-containing protein [Ferrigenium kumadai]
MSIEDAVECLKDALIRRMGGKAYLRPTGLIETLAGDTDESALTVRQALARLVKQGWLDGVAPDGTPFRQVRIVGPAPQNVPDPAEENWRSALNGLSLSDADKNALLPLGIKLADFDLPSLLGIAEGLIRLRSSLPSETGRHRYLVSAKYLLGSSKLLDSLPSNALRRFGIPIEEFPSHPLYVVVAGCAEPEMVVLVENPAAFEMAITTRAAARCAFISTFGFGLSNAAEDYGNQLASMVEDRFVHAITLRRDGAACRGANELLSHKQISFWGDMDPAGIAIYLRLKKGIPSLQLSALYEPMIPSLSDPTKSHPYIKATGKERQQDMPKSNLLNDPLASHLLDLCASRGVDQEQVSPSDVESFAVSSLELKQLPQHT